MEEALVRALETAVQLVAGGSHDAMFVLVRALPCVNKSLAATARLDARFPYILSYVNAVVLPPSQFFFAGIPRQVHLFSGNVPAGTAANLPPSLAGLSYRSVLQDRQEQAQLIHNKAQKRVAALAATNTPNDLPAGVPLRVGIYIARLRAVAQGVRAAKNVAEFPECEHRGCRQRFLRADANIIGSDDLGGLRATPEPSVDYWRLLSGMKAEAPPARRFCSPECCAQFTAELNTAVPKLTGKVLNAEPDPGLKLSSSSRVCKGLRAAAQRNEDFARKLRSVQRPRLRACPSAAYKEKLAAMVRMLNLDFLMLYSSSILAESKALSQGLVLAGEKSGWRHRPRFYAASIKNVKKLLDAYHRDQGTVLHNLLLSSRLLAKVKENAIAIYR